MFEMSNCRNLLINNDMTNGLMQTLVHEIERAVSENSNGVFCLAYSLVDTICKTILDQRGLNEANRDDLPRRFRTTLRELDLTPPDYDNGNREGVANTLRGLEQAVRGLCELRNEDGIYSHGKLDRQKSYDRLQVMLAAQSADMIASYLLQAHLDYPILAGEIVYEDHDEFNEYIDELHESINIFGQIFVASRVLYLADGNHDTYREALEQFKLLQEENNDGA